VKTKLKPHLVMGLCMSFSVTAQSAAWSRRFQIPEVWRVQLELRACICASHILPRGREISLNTI